MGHQYRTFQVTIPAGTPIAAPVTVPVTFESFDVASVYFRIPPGPLGQVGFRLASSRQQVVPWNAGAWIIANDEELTFPATGWPNSGDWQIIAYNTGVFPHSIWVTFELDPVTDTGTVALTATAIALSNVAPVEDATV